MKKALTVIAAGVLLITITSTTFAKDMVKNTAKELIQKIIESEKKIHDFELHCESIMVKSNHVDIILDFGLNGDKLYIAGKRFAIGEPERNFPAYETEFKSSFDGKKFFSMDERISFSNGQVIRKGLAGGISTDLYFVYLNPRHLLGWEIVKKHHNYLTVTLGELLDTSEKVSLRPKLEDVDGHLCAVLEAVGAKTTEKVGNVSGDWHENATYDVRVWIDTERDFRPLRIETYYGYQGPMSIQQAISRQKRWMIFRNIIDKIKLEKIDGLWFPVDGTFIYFQPAVILPPAGMTTDLFQNLPLERQVMTGKFEQKEAPSAQERLLIDLNTVRINRGIDPKKFAIEFPKGCEVWDQTRLKNYTIGQEGDPSVDKTTSGSTIPERLELLGATSNQEIFKNKRLLIYFWKMDDVDSQRIVRQLGNKEKEFLAKDILVVLVHSAPVEEKTVQGWLSKNKIAFPCGMVNKAYEARQWSNDRVPFLVLTDKEHLIIANEGLRLEDIDEKIKNRENK